MHILPAHYMHAARGCQTPLLLVIHTGNHLNGMADGCWKYIPTLQCTETCFQFENLVPCFPSSKLGPWQKCSGF